MMMVRLAFLAGFYAVYGCGGDGAGNTEVVSTAAAPALPLFDPASASALDWPYRGPDATMLRFPPPATYAATVTGYAGSDSFRMSLIREYNTQDIGSVCRGYVFRKGAPPSMARMQVGAAEDSVAFAGDVEPFGPIDLMTGVELYPLTSGTPADGRLSIGVALGPSRSTAQLSIMPIELVRIDAYVYAYEELEVEVGGDYSRAMLHFNNGSAAAKAINEAMWRFVYPNKGPAPSSAVALQQALLEETEVLHADRQKVLTKLAASAPGGEAELYEVSEVYDTELFYADDTLLCIGVARLSGEGGVEATYGTTFLNFDPRAGSQTWFDADGVGARRGRLMAALEAAARRYLGAAAGSALERPISTVPLPTNVGRLPGAWMFAYAPGEVAPEAVGQINLVVADEAWGG